MSATPNVAAEVAYFVFGIERPFPPRRFFLSRSLLDPALGAFHCCLGACGSCRPQRGCMSPERRLAL
jgi:hypothetical protein